KPVAAMLSGLGLPHVSYDAWVAAEHFADFRKVHDSLTDMRSQEVLRAVLMAMLTGDKSPCQEVCEAEQYFCLPRFRGAAKEIYIDAGAFDGDSVEAFFDAHEGVAEAVHAFEPGPYQFSALKARAERLAAEWKLAPGSIRLNNAGLGDSNGR